MEKLESIHGKGGDEIVNYSYLALEECYLERLPSLRVTQYKTREG